jgi:hypothetical protein
VTSAEAADARRRANDLAAPPVSVTILKIALMAAAGVVVVLIGNHNRGVGSPSWRAFPGSCSSCWCWSSV